MYGTSSLSRPQPLHRTIRITPDACSMVTSVETPVSLWVESVWRHNALVQLQAHYHHRGEAASETCLSAATFVRSRHTSLAALRVTRNLPSALSTMTRLLGPIRNFSASQGWITTTKSSPWISPM